MLGELIKAGRTNREIGEVIKRPLNAIKLKAHRHFGGNPNYQIRITKHKHLREPAMEFFLKHTRDETADKFDLTASELRSLFQIAYQKPELKHLRKEKCRHNKWTVDELIYLLRHAGLRQLSWIADQINRGSGRIVQEKLQNLGVNSKTLNGMTLSRFQRFFNCEPEISIEGDAGANRGGRPSSLRIVPWVYIEAELIAGKLAAPNAFVALANAMADFQKWIHGTDPIMSIWIAATTGHAPPFIKQSHEAHQDI